MTQIINILHVMKQSYETEKCDDKWNIPMEYIYNEIYR